MKPDAARAEAYRRRREAGRAMVMYEIDILATESMLERSGLLPMGRDHTRDELCRALAAMNEALCEQPE